ncbi:bis(5'-nucleosyl)-tetraphosphatase (symmetrical) [Comamonas serinivorans]|uniref:bis(5'-nucleosyl)-tetraphosphatase (symmetrical) n=1 Tax=Comamonas serinivorans TaxID=1082851 RepID=A0A1Y0ETX4_9BURK|nr:symmetrical bis(5'-nucleosyl)-tetraphosphatase [Comamonas serinivorans]ARU06809.1 bis(5'-nucleosyl)-tetraphosphatase (symmetrical) [Comamonas serinivorans]
MALYCIGDLQGCASALDSLLAALDFSPSRDTAFFLGDLVNRGPDSLGCLQRVHALGDAARCLLGNHDIHLLAVSQGLRTAGRKDTLGPILQAPDAAAWMDWLRRQPLALHAADTLMVHAGVLPDWTCAQTLALAAEVQAALSGPDWREVLAELFGNEPAWSPALTGAARLRAIVNALTRLRYCAADGRQDFENKVTTDAPPPGFMPWFDVPGRQTAHDTVVFGHWSTLGWLNRQDVFSIDSGCVWGGQLTALELGTTPADHRPIRVPCPQAQAPGRG